MCARRAECRTTKCHCWRARAQPFDERACAQVRSAQAMPRAKSSGSFERLEDVLSTLHHSLDRRNPRDCAGLLQTRGIGQRPKAANGEGDAAQLRARKSATPAARSYASSAHTGRRSDEGRPVPTPSSAPILSHLGVRATWAPTGVVTSRDETRLTFVGPYRQYPSGNRTTGGHLGWHR